jgi:hypothetical protein
MKQFILLLLITPFLLVSCSNDETLNDSNTNKNMLESYVIKRNANGSYTLTHVPTSGVGTVYYDDEKVNEVQLYYDEQAVVNTSSKDYNVVNNELKINFVTENGTYQPKIRIMDENTTEKGAFGLLKDYSFTENPDGTIQLSFEVDANVKVEYGYSNSENSNDIVLSTDTNATQKTFTKTFSRDDDGTLKIDFVQPKNPGKTDDDIRKPRVVVDEF